MGSAHTGDATEEDIINVYRSAKAFKLAGKSSGIQIIQDKHGKVTRVTRWIGVKYKTPFNDACSRVGEMEKIVKVGGDKLEWITIGVQTFFKNGPLTYERWVPFIPQDVEKRLRAEVEAIWNGLDQAEAEALKAHEENLRAKLAGKGEDERIRKGFTQLCRAVKGTERLDGLTPAGMERVFRLHATYGCLTQTKVGSVQFDSEKLEEVEAALAEEGVPLRAFIREAHLWAAATRKKSELGTFLQYVRQNPMIAVLLNRSHVEEAQKLSLVEGVMEA